MSCQIYDKTIPPIRFGTKYAALKNPRPFSFEVHNKASKNATRFTRTIFNITNKGAGCNAKNINYHYGIIFDVVITSIQISSAQHHRPHHATPSHHRSHKVQPSNKPKQDIKQQANKPKQGGKQHRKR